jgi:hypothetical protein
MTPRIMKNIRPLCVVLALFAGIACADVVEPPVIEPPLPTPQEEACTAAIPTNQVSEPDGTLVAGFGLFDQVNCPNGQSSGAEDLYVITPTQDGLIAVDLLADFDAVLYARNDCDDAQALLDCSDEIEGQVETILFAVTGGVPIIVFVDALTEAEGGDYLLDIQFAVN